MRAGERVHVVGAAGAGASAAVILAHDALAEVSGCDPAGHSPYTPAIEALGISLAGGHDPRHVTAAPAPDRLAVTKALTAVDPHNAELEAARAAGIPIEPWQQVIADAAAGRLLVGVAGTHGKSTTSGWLVHVLVQAGLDPSAFVGALLPASITGGLPSTARSGSGKPFVVEADEYAGNFDPYRPGVAVLSSAGGITPTCSRTAPPSSTASSPGWRRPPLRWASPSLSPTFATGVVAVVQRLRFDGWPGRLVCVSIDGPARSTGRQAWRRPVQRQASARAPRPSWGAGAAAIPLGHVARTDPDRDHAGDRRVCLLRAADHQAGPGGPPQRGQRTGRGRRGPGSRRRAGRHPRGARQLQGHGRRPGAKRRGGASSCKTIMATIRPRSVRLSRPSARESRGSASGPCTSRSRTTGRPPCSASSRRCL